MIRLLTLLFVLVPQGAVALSCMPWGAPNAFLAAEASEEAYVPVLGALRFDTRELPTVDMSNQDQVPELTSILATFDGVFLGRRGNQPWSTSLTLYVACYGPWCSQPEPGPVLALLRKNGAQYVLETNPCGGFLFQAPTAEQVQEMRDCLSGRHCRERALR